MTTITLHNVTLTDNRPIGQGLFAGRCAVDGGLRIHNGKFFRGYTMTGYMNRKDEERFGIHVWGSNYAKTVTRRRTGWKTLKGAERALITNAIRLAEVSK